MKIRDMTNFGQGTPGMPTLSKEAKDLLRQFDVGAQLYGLEMGEQNACDGTKDNYHNTKRALAQLIAKLEKRR